MLISPLKMKTVRNFEYGASLLVNYITSFLPHSVITIGFNPTTYTFTESIGNVNVTVNILNGTLARDVQVLLMTSLTDSTATGIDFQ